MTTAHAPRTLSEALPLLNESVTVVAGCTDLMVQDHSLHRSHQAVLDVLRLPELLGIREDGDWLDIGAAVTFSALRIDPLILKHAPVLAEVSATIGAWQIQNRATLGGNIINASPAGDSLPMLLALGAEVVLASAQGTRTLSYDAMHTGYRTTARAANELLVRVRVPKSSISTQARFVKVGTRAAQAISKVMVGLWVDSVQNQVRDIRIAAGSVAATPVRLSAVEQLCRGQKLSAQLADQAGEAASQMVTPIDDVRSTAEYRRHVLGRVVRRAILSLGVD